MNDQLVAIKANQGIGEVVDCGKNDRIIKAFLIFLDLIIALIIGLWMRRDIDLAFSRSHIKSWVGPIMLL